MNKLMKWIRHHQVVAFLFLTFIISWELGFSVERLQIAVLVQQLVAADVSAVVFSANPVTGKVMDNASWGLDESNVCGAVTPHTFFSGSSLS